MASGRYQQARFLFVSGSLFNIIASSNLSSPGTGVKYFAGTFAGCILLMLTKVVLSGLIFGSLSAIWFSLAGGALSLAVMLAVRKNPGIGALCIGFLAVAAEVILIVSRPALKGQILLFAILIGVGAAGCFVIWFLIRKGILCKVQGTSIAGAVAHNIGQVIAAWFVVRTPMLLNTYLPVLIGAGIIMGCLTGIVTERVLKALKVNYNS